MLFLSIMNDIQRNVKNLIKVGQTDEALFLLLDFFKNRSVGLYNQLILISNEYNRIKSAHRIGTEFSGKSFQKVNSSILEIVDEFASSVSENDAKALVKEIFNSEKWFRSLKNHLKVATSLKAYLKEFRAPKEAWKSNLEHILEINLQFARLIHEHLEKTHIVGYFPANLPLEESPINWLSIEVAKYSNGNVKQAEEKVRHAVKLLNVQPMPNSYTVYIIDDTRLFYNFLSAKGNYEFFDIELSSSIIPYFLNRGFEQFLKEIK